MKKPIYFSYGSQNNIKITKKEDLDLFEGYVMMKRKRSIASTLSITESYNEP